MENHGDLGNLTICKIEYKRSLWCQRVRNEIFIAKILLDFIFYDVVKTFPPYRRTFQDDWDSSSIFHGPFLIANPSIERDDTRLANYPLSVISRASKSLRLDDSFGKNVLVELSIDRTDETRGRLRIVSYVVVSYDSKSSSSEQRVRLFLHVFSSQYHRAQSTQSSCATYRSLSWLTIIKLESIIIWRLIHFVVSIRILIYNGRQRSYPNY